VLRSVVQLLPLQAVKAFQIMSKLDVIKSANYASELSPEISQFHAVKAPATSATKYNMHSGLWNSVDKILLCCAPCD
jgi:hypothetical protein